MSDEDDEERAKVQFAEQERAREFWQPVLDRACKLYDHGITTVWVGNAGAALATLSFIGATWAKPPSIRPLLLPLAMFLLGLVSMGIGSMLALYTASARVRRMENAGSLLEFQMQDIRSASEEAGLTMSDWRTRMAFIAASLFVGGCITGFVQLAAAL